MVRVRSDAHRALFAVHGLGVQLVCDAPALWSCIDHLLGVFGVLEFPLDFTTTNGHIRPYNENEVARSVSTSATRVPVPDDLLELYQDGERFWLVDERWGLCELNVLKGSWRSWVLPHPSVDEFRCVEMAVLWPLAQLLKRRGLELVPAVSIEREGFGVLMVGGFNLLPEIDALLRQSGFKLVAQRWTALREDRQRVELLHLPGLVEQITLPRPGSMALPAPGGWTDLHDYHPPGHGFCNTVLLIEPGRRQSLHWQDLCHGLALAALRDHWPTIDLQPAARASPVVSQLSKTCRVGKLQLSRDPFDLMTLLDELQDAATPHVTLTIAPSISKKPEARQPVAV